MQHLTTSMIKSFKNCRRRYWFEYVEQIKPITATQPLRFGSLVHAGLEALLAGRDYHEAISLLAAQDDSEIPADQLADPDIAHIAVAAYAKHVDWRAWQVQSVEQEFAAPLGWGIRLLGKVDAIGAVNGVVCLVEHKTASAPNESYFHHLLWDDQATNYLAAAQLLGIPACGILYDVIEKCGLKPLTATQVENRKYTKDGKLYAAQREQDEPYSDYLIRVATWYDNPSRFQQRLITRNKPQIREAKADLKKVAKDMRDCARQDAYYRNPQACSIYGCPYQSVCLEYSPEVIDVTYRKKDRANEELSGEFPTVNW